ncbi:MAG TPA: DUF92 domain-containing protein [Vicinamibacterales bacterium]|nr:DUF92 domain-containing protein [Vicinamibacterales bacterium]
MSPGLSRRQAAAAKADHSETTRQFVHMAMGGFALLLRWIPWWQAVVLAAGAVVFNLFVLPRVAAALYRPGDRERGVHGILLYPLAILFLLLAFPARLDIVAAAWGILAIGDGLATLAGRAIGGQRWAWNRDKTVAGSAAFAAGGACAGIFLAWWCRPAVSPAPPMLFVLAAPLVASVCAALVETIPARLDDNVSVAASAAAVLWIVSLVDIESLQYAGALAASRLPAALALNALVAWAGHRARTVTLSGALVGASIGVTIYCGTGWQGWALLLVTFVAASLASRVGLTRKTLLGIAEERGGRRGAGNAIANTGAAALASVVVLTSADTAVPALAFAAALAAGGSDTMASEIGKAWGRRTWSITSLARVPPGTSGAMSLEGTLAGIAGAAGLGLAAIALGLIPRSALWIVVAASTAGALLESWLGATLEGPGILNNDMLNFINTAAAALLAVALAAWLG